jgi:hypothetical protein
MFCLQSHNSDSKEKGPIVVRWLLACAFVVALSGGVVGCGSTEKRGGQDGGSVGGGTDGGSVGKGTDGGSSGQSSDVYLTCKLNGESVRIDGTGTVVANYQVKEDETVVQTGGPQKYRFLFNIPGKTTGDWQLGDPYLALMVTDMNATTIWESSTDQDDKGATLQVGVTSYGSVGGYIDGTFSGTAVNISDSSKLVVTDGQFRALRITDI